jgi:Domain of unknown function (DUF6471)
MAITREVFVGIAYDDRRTHCRRFLMKTEDDWKTEAKRIFRTEMTRRGVTYDRLVELLREIGVEESVPNIKNKISRGKFDFTFMLKCMEAIGCKTLNISCE